MLLRVPVIQHYGLIFIFSLTTLISGINPARPIQEQDQNEVNLGQFDMLTASSGWVLLDQHLFWTTDAEQNWNEIGPAIPLDATVQDAEFIDSNTGWILWSMIAPQGSSLFQLAHTTDHGATWTIHPLSLFESGEIASFPEKAEMGWFDTQTGWISVKQISGSNFSLGTLFTSSDGGNTWDRSTLPLADQIYFHDPQVGWAVGGPADDQVFKTQDAGHTWQALEPDDIPENTLAAAYMPFYSNGQGLLVMTNLGFENSLKVYSLNNSFDKWLTVNEILLDVEPGIIGLSILDSQNFVAVIPETSSIVRMKDGALHTIDNEDGLSASIVELDMVSLNIGWAKSVDSSCITLPKPHDQAVSVSCSSSARLLRTMDGGITWQSVILPFVRSDSAPFSILSSNQATVINSLPNSGNTQIFIGQGFDKCEIPTLSQLKTWSQNSPYKVVNLYIGGSSRACENSVLTSSYLQQLYQQGWKFIPTWVGPQAPCTGFNSRMSSDGTIAAGQGVAEANLAVERLAELGLTNPDKTGSVIYYDIEHYGIDPACRNAVNSFMNGWVSQIRAHGNLAGVYGSTLCNTGLSDFRFITNVPDLIWPARWFHNYGSGYYDPNASVWDLGSCIPNDIWANHERIRQYEGGTNETWGNLTLEIDSNVLDGVVGLPYGFPAVSSITRADTNPTNLDNVDFMVVFSESVTGVDATDFTLVTTSVVSGAAVSEVSGTGSVYTVTVNTGSGNGTIRLNVVDDDTIVDEALNPLAVGFTSAEIYTIIKSATFGDVPLDYWASSYIERLYIAGITGGCETSPLNYCPDSTVTRAQMAVFLLKGIHGSSYAPPVLVGDTGFGDVSPTYWAATWIKQLAAEGITGGCGGGNYCPDATVTRAQMAIFLLKAKHGASYSPPNATGVFTDVPKGYWADKWIEQLAAEGITGGCGGGYYCPDAEVTRAQMAVFLVKAFGLP